MNVSAVIVTRGDVPLEPCFAPLADAGINDIVVWNNATAEQDLSVYGRYEAIGSAVGAAIVVQDDDVILDAESVRSLIDAYVPGHVVCNMPQRFRDTGSYEDSALVGLGAIFDRDLPAIAFERFTAHWPSTWTYGDSFLRECDTVFTGLTPRILVDLPYTDRAFASAPGRLWRQADHVNERKRVRELMRQVRDAA